MCLAILMDETRNHLSIYSLVFFHGFFSGSSLFGINSSTGRIYIAETLSSQSFGSYLLMISVHDSIGHADNVIINIIISDQEDVVDWPQNAVNSDVTIAICASFATLLLAAVVVAVFFYLCLRRYVS